ncbi:MULTISPECIES: helix-turn-helix domain-containing protein [Weeksellaceae]|uniref:helix-turn-helix domain-containing protein n=1 Tax=Weeksellaceae TaxID=2762318 RepID=UPI000F4D6CD0|nr:helix-turn-helix transcriptional regulator [Chryseobacterium bernardetii]AZB33418.1 XRE family transcriptional regulator [Chryseobacterium bernardetii]MCT4328040.1 helix-turn-helix transcriptional regulator [Elizabethkingia anophelis]
MNESLDEIERYVIKRVKEIREAKNITQEELSLSIGKNIGFISQIEAPSKKAKYNLIHLNMIAIALGCSIKDFLPNEPIRDKKYDIKEIMNKKS